MASCRCEVLFSWKPDKSPNNITLFSTVDPQEIGGELDREDECFRHDIQEENLLHLQAGAGVDELENQCILRLNCSSDDQTAVVGFTIISESRTVEVSNDTDGYITTARGRIISHISSSSSTSWYLSTCHFSQSYSHLNLKFLSLGDRTTFSVHSLVVKLSHCAENRSLHTRGTFDLNKLKKDLGAIENTVSYRARDLLATMEQYKLNKVNHLEDQMMFLQQFRQPPASSPAQGLSSIMNSLLPAASLKSLLEESQTEKQDVHGGNLHVYRMLQTVCSRVSDMRSAQLAPDNISATPDSGTHSASRDDEDFDDKRVVPMDELLTFVEQKMNQVRDEMRTELLELKREVTLQITTVAAEVNSKLDIIMSVLHSISVTKEDSQLSSKLGQDDR